MRKEGRDKAKEGRNKEIKQRKEGRDRVNEGRDRAK